MGNPSGQLVSEQDHAQELRLGSFCKKAIKAQQCVQCDLDQMSVVLAMDNQTAEDLKPMAPHMNIFSMAEPRKLSSAAVFPKPVAATVSNWLFYECKEPNKAQLDFMRELAA